MGLFGNLFGKTESTSKNTTNPTTSNEVVPSVGILNLKKNDILDLSKSAPNLTKVRVAAGWDVADTGQDYDLDLCAFLLDKSNHPIENVNAKIYFANMKSSGIYLDGDNLTGEGDGDDENIFVNLSSLPETVERIIFNVVIYEGKIRRQQLGNVKNAYVRLVDESGKSSKELCRFTLTGNGADNTAIVFAEMYKSNGSWNFRAIGDYTKASIDGLYNELI